MPQDIAKGIALGQLDPFTQLPFQAESVTPKLAVDDISRPKSFKPETVKKKLDLPVQKNLLTKYFCILKWRIPYISLQFITFGMGFTWFSRIFVLIKMSCFASVEAKRKFKAPRISPMSLTPTDESPSIPDDNTPDLDALSSQTTNESPVYSLGENPCVSEVAEKRDSPDDDAVERNHKDLHHKYCEREVDRPKSDSLKVIVRSKYFKQKQEDKSLKQSIPCLNDCSVIGQRKAVKTWINMSSASKREESHRAIATSPCLHHDRIYNDHEDAKEASFSAMNEVAERTINTHKINHQINEEEQNPSVEIPSAFSTPENVIPLSSIAIDSCHGVATGKRKLDSDENLHKENLKSKHMRMDETDTGNYRNSCSHKYLDLYNCYIGAMGSLTETDFIHVLSCEALNAETPLETDDVEKFGSNISHIGHYSEIAEKSVERFVSAISSFKYSGTGSRASGLRAPLKDIRNTCPSKGLSLKPDISKFGYASSNRHMVTKSRRM
ncbi:Exonuclease 1 [Arabidopsis thaliana]